MKTYIKPEMEINELNISEILVAGSVDNRSILEDGGSTSVNKVYEADSKQRGEGFDFLW